MKRNKNKHLNMTVVVEEQNVQKFFDDIYKFCEQAERETKLEKTKLNMKAKDWVNYPESLMYRLYKSRKYDNGNGAIVLVYDGKKLCAISGVERHTETVAIMGKRLYVLKEYRSIPIFTTHIVNPQIEWAKKKNFKVCLLTINEYQKFTILRMFLRAQKKKAIVFGKQRYNGKVIFEEMRLMPVKVLINGEYQYVITYKIDKDYHFNLEEIADEPNVK